MTAFHKHDDRDDLLALASDVYASVDGSHTQLTARDAARALVGVAGWVSLRVGIDGMQDRMAQLVRHAPAWESGAAALHDLPTQYNGYCDELLALIAVVASGFVSLFGIHKLRAAMAFWATERDASVWQTLAA